MEKKNLYKPFDIQFHKFTNGDSSSIIEYFDRIYADSIPSDEQTLSVIREIL